MPPLPIPGVGNRSIDPIFLGIIPTRACNLSCRYCGFGALAADTDTMDCDLANNAVDWMAAYARHCKKKSLDIHFFGGEPFFAPHVVEAVVQRGRQAGDKHHLVPKFQVSTNGFFDEKRCRYVGDHFDAVVLSFDGFEEIHNQHRPLRNGAGSFRVVARNAAILSKSSAELNIRVCVTEDSVAVLDKICEWFCQNFNSPTINFETIQPTPESEKAGLRLPDPWQFIKMVRKSFELSRSFGVRTIYNSSSTKRLRHSFCPVGKDALIVTPAGQVNACYMLEQDWQKGGLDLRLGKVLADGTLDVDMQAVQRVRQITEVTAKCRTCFCQWYCAGGCHVQRNVNPQDEVRKNFCIQTRVLAACHLLDDLGADVSVHKFVDNQEAMERLAFQRSDTLSDWNDIHMAGWQ